MAKNTHLEHIEDDIINSGKVGGFNAINFLESLGKMLSQPMGMSPIKITTKWDGAPAIVCGKNPENGMFFVGTKSVFNKGVPKIGYTEDLIDYHYPNPGLNSILKTCLEHLPKLGINGVIQGDLLFTDNKKYQIINNDSVISFQPNTIVYTVPVNSPMGKKIHKAKMGIVFHTGYNGSSLQAMNATFGVDTSNFKNLDDVFFASATFTDADNVARFTGSEKAKFQRLINKTEGSLKQASAFLNVIKEQGEGRFMMSVMFKKFMNTFYRDKNKVVSNVQNIVREFEAFYTKELQIEIVTKKTIVARTKYTKILAEGLIFLKLNSRSLYFTIASYMNIIEAKLFVIRKLEMVKTLGTFLRTDNGYQVTAPEGFVAIQSGNALKLVDRLEFSRANFTAAKNWEQR